ncbi:hypothetical protein ABT237_25270 [Streptomyces sp. NPDC001581]
MLARAEAGWARFLTLDDPDPLLEGEEEAVLGDGPGPVHGAA